QLEVHLGPERLRALECLDHHVERELPVLRLRDRQADTVDRDRIADSDGDPALDDEPTVAEGRDPATLGHDPGEHGAKATPDTEKAARSRAAFRRCESCAG